MNYTLKYESNDLRISTLLQWYDKLLTPWSTLIYVVTKMTNQWKRLSIV